MTSDKQNKELAEAALIALRLLDKIYSRPLEAQLNPERVETLWKIVCLEVLPPQLVKKAQK